MHCPVVTGAKLTSPVCISLFSTFSHLIVPYTSPTRCVQVCPGFIVVGAFIL